MRQPVRGVETQGQKEKGKRGLATTWHSGQAAGRDTLELAAIDVDAGDEQEDAHGEDSGDASFFLGGGGDP